MNKRIYIVQQDNIIYTEIYFIVDKFNEQNFAPFLNL